MCDQMYPGVQALIVRSVVLVSVALGMLTGSVLASAQTPQKVFRVGYLSTGDRTPDGAPPVPFRDALRGLGYVEGRNVAYETRFGEGNAERLPGLAAELVALKVDVIAAQGGLATMAVKKATQSIPIVIARASGDAVAVGLIESQAHPGGNVTGLTDEVDQLSAKRMQILKEAVPKAALIAVLWNANDPGMTIRYRGIENAARILNVEVQAIAVRGPDDFAIAFSTMSHRRPDAIFLVADPFMVAVANRKRILEYAATNGIPAMYEFSFLVREGGLISYGASPEEEYQRAAYYIDRILKGAKPADLPAEQPTRYYLTVNLKTANMLGITIPSSLLVRADDVLK